MLKTVVAPLKMVAWYGRVKAATPALAFFGGFLWDAATLGRSIQSLDLFILLAYLAGAGGLLVWLGRKAPRGPAFRASLADGSPAEGAAGLSAAEPGWGAEAVAAPPGRLRFLAEQVPTFTLQFCFGGLFSALVIFYFLSSSYLPGFLTVGLLTALLVGNEFMEHQYKHKFTLTWTLFGVCSILFLNFALPHLFHSVSPVWFYLSTAGGMGLLLGLRKLTPRAEGSLWPAWGVAGVLVALFIFNFIPPVPMVKKNLAICRELVKQEGRYAAKMEAPPLYFFWRRSDALVHQRPGEKVFCFTSVFLPSGIECTLYHRWMWLNPRNEKWMETSRIGFPIRGGRKEGYRGYTYKRNMAPGKWKVLVETESGQVLGLTRFQVEAAPAEYAPDLRGLTLD